MDCQGSPTYSFLHPDVVPNFIYFPLTGPWHPPHTHVPPRPPAGHPSSHLLLGPTSCWVLSVLLHSSLRFSSSERSTVSHRRWVAPPGSSLLRPKAPVPPARPREGLRPARAKTAAASPMLGSSPASGPPSARLYSAHKFRMVSRRWRSWGGWTEQGVRGEGWLPGGLEPGTVSRQERGLGL